MIDAAPSLLEVVRIFTENRWPRRIKSRAFFPKML